MGTRRGGHKKRDARCADAEPMQRTPKGTPDASLTVPPEGFPIFRAVPPEGFATRGPFHPKASRPVGPFHPKAFRSADRSTRRLRDLLDRSARRLRSADRSTRRLRDLLDRSARRLSDPQTIPPEGFAICWIPPEGFPIRSPFHPKASRPARSVVRRRKIARPCSLFGCLTATPKNRNIRIFCG